MSNLQLKITSKSMLELHKHAFKAQLKGHQEVCGVILRNSNGFLNFEYLVNRSTKPGAFQFNVTDIEPVSERASLLGQEVIGSFHSHPLSEPVPGDGDIKNAFYKNIEFIYDVCGREGRLWQLKDNNLVVELDFKVISDSW